MARPRLARLAVVTALAARLGTASVSAQPVPKPFPTPTPPGTPTPAPASPAPPAPTPAQAGTPTDASLGVPVYPGAQYLATFDAGFGQQYVLFGTNASFSEIVAYYRTVLKQRGTLVFDEPPVHTFEVGRFREETMAFPPGVTVKDYTWDGSPGYLHVQGSTGTRYRTIIQIVPVPPQAKR